MSHEPEGKSVSFKRWCENNGRRWIGAKNFEEFERNALDYGAYLDKHARDQVGEELQREAVLKDQDLGDLYGYTVGDGSGFDEEEGL